MRRQLSLRLWIRSKAYQALAILVVMIESGHHTSPIPEITNVSSIASAASLEKVRASWRGPG